MKISTTVKSGWERTGRRVGSCLGRVGDRFKSGCGDDSPYEIIFPEGDGTDAGRKTGPAGSLPDKPKREEAPVGPENRIIRSRRTLRVGAWRIPIRVLILSTAGVALAAVLGLGIHTAYGIFISPETLFSRAIPTLKPVQTPPPTAAPGETASTEPTATAEVDPYQYYLSIADQEMMKGIVNVLVIGVDYADERATWNKNFYSDVMLVLAINFNENKVDMISVPRDTYAKIANIDGIYKLNSSVYHGGGVPNGFTNVCQSVSGVLGGIPVDYYVGVTMPTVKELVNAVGGVDYDVDVTIHLQGRTIEPGYQHMDGQMVLDYLRARKGIDNDLGRINRQKKMLLAIFKKMQADTSILNAPSLFMQFKDKLYTNMTAAQIAALTVFAYNLNSENVAMHTLGGTNMDIFNWLFLITDQEKRVELIREVYGIEVPEQVEYSKDYCVWMWADKEGRGFLRIVSDVLMKDDAATVRKISWDNRIAIQAAVDSLWAELEKQKEAWRS
jgi:LCP family protein required for cell wall assembly